MTTLWWRTFWISCRPGPFAVRWQPQSGFLSTLRSELSGKDWGYQQACLEPPWKSSLEGRSHGCQSNNYLANLGTLWTWKNKGNWHADMIALHVESSDLQFLVLTFTITIMLDPGQPPWWRTGARHHNEHPNLSRDTGFLSFLILDSSVEMCGKKRAGRPRGYQWWCSPSKLGR